MTVAQNIYLLIKKIDYYFRIRILNDNQQAYLYFENESLIL